MTITVDLRRVGSSRVSVSAITLVARVKQGKFFGEDMLTGMCITDPVTAKAAVRDKLAAKLIGNHFEIKWEEAPEV